MDWSTEATKSNSIDTDAVLKGYQEGRSRQGNGFTNFAVGGAQGMAIDSYRQQGGSIPFIGLDFTTGYDLIGIKASEVEHMRNSIRDYVTRVQGKVDETLQANNEELNKAVRGAEVIKEVNAYIDKVKLYCQNVTSGLLVFSDKLADVGNAWIAATEKMASTVNSSTGAFSEGSKYSDDAVYNGTGSSASAGTSNAGGGGPSNSSFSSTSSAW